MHKKPEHVRNTMPEGTRQQSAGPRRSLQEQCDSVAALVQGPLAHAVPLPFVILNMDRAVVYANKHAVKLFKAESPEAMVGLRPGESMYCVHALSFKECGTNGACEHCGTVQAVFGALQCGEYSDESNVLTERRGRINAFTLRVDAHAIEVDGSPYVMVFLRDISKEKDREMLEQVFLHDALNALGGIQGASHLVADMVQGEARELSRAITDRAAQMVREVEFLQLFFSAEENTLSPRIEQVSALQLLQTIRTLCLSSAVAGGKYIEISGHDDIVLQTDKGLLQRSLENLVINALEASAEGETVFIGWLNHGRFIQFFVKNRSFISRTTQRKLFQRSFSTKGRGRGIGAYSTRMFVTNYLGGSVSFESTPEDGTTFYVQVPIA